MLPRPKGPFLWNYVGQVCLLCMVKMPDTVQAGRRRWNTARAYQLRHFPIVRRSHRCDAKTMDNGPFRICSGNPPRSTPLWKEEDDDHHGPRSQGAVSDGHLGSDEAIDLGMKLEKLCGELSPRQREFLRTALGVAATDLWARTNESLTNRSILDLVIDIQAAGVADAISLNPLPIPREPKGPTT